VKSVAISRYCDFLSPAESNKKRRKTMAQPYGPN
jgi:hypothetical protein